MGPFRFKIWWIGGAVIRSVAGGCGFKPRISYMIFSPTAARVKDPGRRLEILLMSRKTFFSNLNLFRVSKCDLSDSLKGCEIKKLFFRLWWIGEAVVWVLRYVAGGCGFKPWINYMKLFSSEYKLTGSLKEAKNTKQLITKRIGGAVGIEKCCGRIYERKFKPYMGLSFFRWKCTENTKIVRN